MTTGAGPGIVAVGGVFDGLHAGHVAILQEGARLACAFTARPLHVLLNSDASLSALKRSHQHSFAQRAQLVQTVVPDALIRSFDDTTPTERLKELVDELVEHDGDDKALVVFVKGVDALVNNNSLDPPELGLWRVACYYAPLTVGHTGAKLRTRREP